MRYAIAVILSTLSLVGQRVPGLEAAAARPYVQSTGESTATAKPDQAKIDIGVVTQAPNASAAATQNTAQVSAVLAELRKVVGAAGEIKTTNYSVSPNYTYPKDGQPTITGYTATNIVEVTLHDLSQVGELIDAATQSGANNIQRLQFTLRNDQQLRAQALRDAAAQARANAEAMASGLGLKVTRVLSIEESQTPTVLPLVRTMSTAAAAPPQTPVETGNIEVRAAVTLRVEIGQ